MCIASIFRLPADYIFFFEIYANSKMGEKFFSVNSCVSLYLKFALPFIICDVSETYIDKIGFGRFKFFSRSRLCHQNLFEISRSGLARFGLSPQEPGARTMIISLGAVVIDERSPRGGRKKKRAEGETICTSLKGVGGASGSSDPSLSAASRREKQFTLPSGLRITFEC